MTDLFHFPTVYCSCIVTYYHMLLMVYVSVFVLLQLSYPYAVSALSHSDKILAQISHESTHYMSKEEEVFSRMFGPFSSLIS